MSGKTLHNTGWITCDEKDHSLAQNNSVRQTLVESLTSPEIDYIKELVFTKFGVKIRPEITEVNEVLNAVYISLQARYNDELSSKEKIHHNVENVQEIIKGIAIGTLAGLIIALGGESATKHLSDGVVKGAFERLTRLVSGMSDTIMAFILLSLKLNKDSVNEKKETENSHETTDHLKEIITNYEDLFPDSEDEDNQDQSWRDIVKNMKEGVAGPATIGGILIAIQSVIKEFDVSAPEWFMVGIATLIGSVMSNGDNFWTTGSAIKDKFIENVRHNSSKFYEFLHATREVLSNKINPYHLYNIVIVIVLFGVNLIWQQGADVSTGKSLYENLFNSIALNTDSLILSAALIIYFYSTAQKKQTKITQSIGEFNKEIAKILSSKK